MSKSLIVKPTEPKMRRGWHPVGWLLNDEEVMFGIADLGVDELQQDLRLDEYVEKLRAQQLSIGNGDFDVLDQRKAGTICPVEN